MSPRRVAERRGLQGPFTLVKDGTATAATWPPHDGKLPSEEDQPAANFFFNAGTEGGRIVVDLGSVIDVKQVNTYSWHPGERWSLQFA